MNIGDRVSTPFGDGEVCGVGEINDDVLIGTIVSGQTTIIPVIWVMVDGVRHRFQGSGIYDIDNKES